MVYSVSQFVKMPAKKTTPQFIEESKEKHSDKYDYSKTVYKNSKEKVIIICQEHGQFLVSPVHHLYSGSGCKKCSGTHQYTTEEFIEEVKKIHGGKYDYSKTVYTKAHDKVTIICRNQEHGIYEFEMKATAHLNQKIGCAKCSGNYSPTTEEFIEHAKNKHGDKYDYSKTVYKKGHEKVTIICPEHGEFEQSPSGHLKTNGCPLCSNEIYRNISLTQNEFLSRAKEKHGDKYDYSKTVYKKGHEKVTIICPEHGEFEQEAKAHMEGQECKTCAIIKNSKTRCFTQNEFLSRAKEKHGDKYDYSKTVYTKGREKVTIICPEHGEFEQEAECHYGGQGCPECSIYNRKVDTDIFIRESKEKHGDKYDYSKTVYTKRREKVTIICPKHGEFEQEAAVHKNGHGCPKCLYKTEGIISEFLSTNWKVICEFKKEWCKNKKTNRFFRFDFCIEELKTIIELDGAWHFFQMGYVNNRNLTLEERHQRDLFKEKCANENGYKVIRLVQQEIFDNKYDWKKKLTELIEKGENCRFSINNIYEGW